MRVCLCVCVSVCVCTFLNARLARTRGPILLRFGTRTKMLIGYRLRELLWDAPILWRHNRVFLFFEAALWRPQFLSNFLEISVKGVKPQGNVGDCTWDWSVNIYCFRYDVILPPFCILVKINQNKLKTCFSECSWPPKHESGFCFCVRRTTSGQAAILFFSKNVWKCKMNIFFWTRLTSWTRIWC